MSLTRKFLSALGIDADKIDEIITAHSETVDGLKEQLKAAQDAAGKLPKVQEELDKLKEAAKNSGDYDKLAKEFEAFKAKTAEEKTAAAKKDALTKIAKDAGLSEAGIAKVLKYTDLATVELDEGGAVKDAKTLVKSIRDEWPEHIVTTRTEGAKIATPPVSDGGKTVKTKDEILAIKDTAERQAAWRDFLAAQQQKG